MIEEDFLKEPNSDNGENIGRKNDVVFRKSRRRQSVAEYSKSLTIDPIRVLLRSCNVLRGFCCKVMHCILHLE